MGRLALTLPNERVGPVQNSQRVAAALGYSYLRVGYYCRNTDLLTKPGKCHEWPTLVRRSQIRQGLIASIGKLFCFTNPE
jgi:hypothetical protein